MFKWLLLTAIAATTSEAMPPYEVIASSGQPVDQSVVIDQHPLPRPQPHPDSAAALNNASVGAVRGGPPRPPTDVTSVRRPDGSVLVQWTPSGDRVDHYTVQYRTVGRWLPLADQLDPETRSFVWTTASRGVVYRFRLLGVSLYSGNSIPSNVATLDVDGQDILGCIALITAIAKCGLLLQTE